MRKPTRVGFGIGASVLLLVVAASNVSAQPLGTFAWQLKPFCNVITVQVTRAGTVFTLDGVDDQCGAATGASVVGAAFPNPDGSIGIGLTTITAPGSVPVGTRIITCGNEFPPAADFRVYWTSVTSAGACRIKVHNNDANADAFIELSGLCAP